MCRAPCADNADGVMVALFQFAPNVKHNWRRMNFPERLGIGSGFLCDDRRAKFANAPNLRGKIDGRFPIRNLVGHFRADSFHLAQLAAFRGEDLLRLLKNLQQSPQPNRPNGRQHIERDASVGRVHRFSFGRAFWAVVKFAGSTESRRTENQKGISSSSGSTGGADLGGGALVLPPALVCRSSAAVSAGTPTLAGRLPSNCMLSPTTRSLVRFCPVCLSSHVSICRRPSMKTGRPFFRYSPAISARRAHSTTST